MEEVAILFDDLWALDFLSSLAPPAGLLID